MTNADKDRLISDLRVNANRQYERIIELRALVGEACAQFEHGPDEKGLIDAIRSLTGAPSYQSRVVAWRDVITARMTPEEAELFNSRMERAFRFGEEALELLQAEGVSRDAAHAIVDYVYNRPVGVSRQEVGGVLMTLAALCAAVGIDMDAAGADELQRVQSPEVMDKIIAKNRQKRLALPSSPLPGSTP